jgi:hypothetical protein
MYFLVSSVVAYLAEFESLVVSNPMYINFCNLFTLQFDITLLPLLKTKWIYSDTFHIVDSSQSSTYKLLSNGTFQIQYVTPNSGVVGDYGSDNFAIGGTTIKALTLAVATQAQDVPTGIMGIGFDTDESIAASGGTVYPNIIDVLVSENIIGSRSYSLYLDDLGIYFTKYYFLPSPDSQLTLSVDSTGTVLFGGYDSDKYMGNLTVLPIQPDSQSGNITSMTVAWTGISITDSSGSTPLNSSDFPLGAVLDSGTTLSVLPPDVFAELATYFGAVSDQTYGTLVPCNISEYQGSVDYSFGGEGGTTISVSFAELALPIQDSNGNELTFEDGSTACSFGLDQISQDSEPVLLGDTFLRSAYVVYDLDNAEIGIAQTKFNSTSSNIQEIGSGSGNVGGQSSIASVSVANTATAKVPDTFAQSKTQTESKVAVTPGHFTSTAGGIGGVGTGATATGAGTHVGATTGTTAPTGTASKAAAAGLAPAFDPTKVAVVGGSFVMVMLGGAFMLFN